jgi:acyl carrier protein
MTTSPELFTSLLQHCVDNGVFARGVRVRPDDDLVESGLVDSMGLLMLASMIEDIYEVVIPEAVFVAELRTLARIAGYIELELRTGRAAHARALLVN